MIEITPFDLWLDGVLKSAERSVFGEPTSTPEEQVIEIEEDFIRETGYNLCRYGKS